MTDEKAANDIDITGTAEAQAAVAAQNQNAAESAPETSKDEAGAPPAHKRLLIRLLDSLAEEFEAAGMDIIAAIKKEF